MRYLAIDTETTGVDPTVDNLLEIGVVLSNTGEDKAQNWHSLINYTGEIPPGSKAIHHIDESEVKWARYNSLEAVEILHAMLHAGEHDQPPTALVAHHAEFDEAFLPELSLAYPWICTERLAKHLWPDADRFGLQFLRYWLKLDVDPPGTPHRALYDATVVAALFEAEVVELADKHPEALLDPPTLKLWAERPLILMKVTFGKHDGKPWSEVDQGYLHWMVEEHHKTNGEAWDPDTMNTVRHHLNQPGLF